MREQLFAIERNTVNGALTSIRTADQDESGDDILDTEDGDDFDDEDDVDDEVDEEAAEEAVAPSGGAQTPPPATAIDQPTSPNGATSGRPAVDDGHGIPKL
jgi:hypothetical protein